MKKNFLLYLILFSPLFATAEEYLEGTSGIFSSAKSIIDTTLTPLAFMVALLLFFWGVAKYIRSEGQGKADGRNLMIWGVVALFVVSSIWGLVRFLRTELKITNNENSMEIPRFGN